MAPQCFENKFIFNHWSPKDECCCYCCYNLLYDLPKLNKNQYIIHDPYKLNCIIKAYPDKVKDAHFIHLCAMTTEQRNNFIDALIQDIKIKFT